VQHEQQTQKLAKVTRSVGSRTVEEAEKAEKENANEVVRDKDGQIGCDNNRVPWTTKMSQTRKLKDFKVLPRMNGGVDDAVREREVAKEGSPKRSSFDWGSKPRKNEIFL